MKCGRGARSTRSIWSRRQLHETLVHRMDLEFAAEVIPQAEPAIAIDAIDEFLSNRESGTTRRNWRCSMVAVRARVRVNNSETPWSITFGEGGFSVSKTDGNFNAELVVHPSTCCSSSSTSKSGSRNVEEIGDRQLVDFWLPTLTSIDSIYSRTVPPSSRCAPGLVELSAVSNTTAGQVHYSPKSEQYSLTRDLPTLRSGFPEEC